MANKKSYNSNRHINLINPHSMEWVNKFKDGTIDLHTTLDFGVHKGKKASEVLNINSGYFLWLSKNTKKRISPSLILADLKKIHSLRANK